MAEIAENTAKNTLAILRREDGSEKILYTEPDLAFYLRLNPLSGYPNMRPLSHWHKEFEYIEPFDESMYYTVNGTTLLVKKGDGLFVNARQIHYGHPYQERDVQFLGVIFDRQLLGAYPVIQERFLQPFFDHSASLPFVYLHRDVPEEAAIISGFHKVYDVYKEKAEGYQLALISALTETWNLLFRFLQPNFATLSTKKDPDIISQQAMLGFIHANYAHPLTLQDIAAAGNVGRSKCCSLFKKYMNRSPMDYVNSYRIEASLLMLRDSSFSITETALACGFQSSSYYSEVFGRQIGMSPREFRRKEQMS